MKELDVRHIRKNLGLTQEEFAKKLWVTKGTIANCESGRVIPRSKQEVLHDLLKEGIRSLDNRKDYILKDSVKFYVSEMAMFLA